MDAPLVVATSGAIGGEGDGGAEPGVTCWRYDGWVSVARGHVLVGGSTWERVSCSF